MGDQQSFFNFMRMPPEIIDALLNDSLVSNSKDGYQFQNKNTRTRYETVYYFTVFVTLSPAVCQTI